MNEAPSADHLTPWSDEWYEALMGKGDEARQFAPHVPVWSEMAARKAIVAAIAWARNNAAGES